MTVPLGNGLFIDGVSKSYPGVAALADVTVHVPAGTVHGLVGENGAGKSTLMKCVTGAVPADAGSVRVDGHEVTGDLRAAEAAGVAMIYQELTIVPELTAAENVFLGALPTRFGVVDRREARRRFDAAARDIGSAVAADVRAGTLSTSAQQQLEIMRALTRSPRVLILDEPTASLGPADVARLHEVIGTLRARGIAIVYISHDLDAVLSVCDTVTVLREGRVVTSRAAAQWSSAELVDAMVGDIALDAAGTRDRTLAPETLLQVEGLRAPGVDVPRLEIRSGEILGIAGLVGSGRSRLLRALAGADPVWSGIVRRRGVRTPWPRSPRRARRAGIMLAPEDRKRQGLVLDRTAAWNVALGRFGATSRGRGVTRGRISGWARPPATAVGFAPERLAAPARTLSGGNQQKLLLARLLGGGASCLLLDEPTRGVDVGAKAQIFDTIRGLVDAGHAVVWSSSDLAEVAHHSDRIVVVAAGRMITELPGGSTVGEILRHAFAATGGTATSRPATEEAAR